MSTQQIWFSSEIRKVPILLDLYLEQLSRAMGKAERSVTGRITSFLWRKVLLDDNIITAY